MIPRSDLQKEVAKLKKRLPYYLNEEQEEWTKTLIYNEECFQDKTGNYCAKCGEHMGDKLKCPHCGFVNKLNYKKGSYHSARYLVDILSYIEGYQAIRTFQVMFEFKKGKPVQVVDNGILCEHYINEKGNLVSFGCSRFMWHYIAGYNIEFRPSNSDWISNSDTWVYKKGKKAIAPFLKKRGITIGLFNNLKCDPIGLIQQVLVNPHIETCLKAKEYNILNYFLGSHDINSYWSQICLARRLHYKIENVKDWIDNINLAKELGLDIHSPKYICPEQFYEMHNMLIHRKDRIRTEEERIRNMELIQKAEPKYRKKIKKYLGLCIESNDITIKPLDSVNAFFEEGSYMHHCVFSNRYYEDNCLILSARIGTERIETIEVSLEDFNIVQSRGRFNKPTEYHDIIIDAVNANMPTIRQMAKAS